MKDKLEQPNQLSITLQGWPFGHGDDSSGESLKF